MTTVCHPQLPHTRRPCLSHAFTLIELLTVIAIIGILAAILIPTVGKVRKSARDAQCRSNLHQIGLAVHLFAHDNRNKFPGGNDYDKDRTPQRITWDKALLPYLARGDTKYDDGERTMLTVCASAPAPLRTNDRIQYSANEYLVSADKSPISMADVDRPSEVIFCADGLTRRDSNYQANAVLRSGLLGVSSNNNPDTAITDSNKEDGDAVSGEGYICYRHGSGSANVVMVDASVRMFGKGTIKHRNIFPSF